MHIGEFLKKYRLRYRISSRKFAVLLNIGESGKGRLEKWEQKKGHPKEEDAELIKKYFSVNAIAELTEDYLKRITSENVPRGALENFPIYDAGDVSESGVIYGKSPPDQMFEKIIKEKDEKIWQLYKIIGRLEKTIEDLQDRTKNEEPLKRSAG